MKRLFAIGLSLLMLVGFSADALSELSDQDKTGLSGIYLAPDNEDGRDIGEIRIMGSQVGLYDGFRFQTYGGRRECGSNIKRITTDEWKKYEVWSLKPGRCSTDRYCFHARICEGNLFHGFILFQTSRNYETLEFYSYHKGVTRGSVNPCPCRRWSGRRPWVKKPSSGKVYKTTSQSTTTSTSTSSSSSSTGDIFCATASNYWRTDWVTCSNKGGKAYESEDEAKARHNQLKGSSSSPSSTASSSSTVRSNPFFGGAYIFGNGIYIGETANDLANGYGVFLTDAQYVGRFIDGSAYGPGVSVNRAGVYLGGFVKGVRHGYGIEMDSDGFILIGHFKDDDSRDTVVFDSLSGRLSGTITNGKYCEGCVPQSNQKLASSVTEFGNVSYADGMFIGHIFNGKPHGYGVLKLENGEYIMGNWHLGAPVGQTFVAGSPIHPGMKYFGELSRGFEPDGLGVVTTESATVIGIFKNSQIWNGTFYSPSGDVVTTVTNGVRNQVVKPTNPNELSAAALFGLAAIIQGLTPKKNFSSDGCSSDFACGVGYRCVKAPLKSTGVCLKAVDQFGIGTLGLPSLDSIGPNMKLWGECMFFVDCPIGFTCDNTLKACVKRR